MFLPVTERPAASWAAKLWSDIAKGGQDMGVSIPHLGAADDSQSGWDIPSCARDHSPVPCCCLL